MEDIGNIVLLVFFLLVGVVSSLAKALSDWMARKRESEHARRAVEKLRGKERGSESDVEEPDRRHAPLGGAGPRPAQGRSPQQPSAGPSEPAWLQDADSGRDPDSGRQISRPEEAQVADAVSLKPHGMQAASPAQQPVSSYVPEIVGAPLGAAPQMAAAPRSVGHSTPVFRVRALNRRSLREAFVLSEIVSPPLALRDL